MALSGIKLTIGIPTYNRDKYLDRCLASICNQLDGSVNEIELLVSDNASTDNTFQVVQKYINKGFNINYYRNDGNMGPDFNIYQCYKKANGRYVLALGDDDLLMDTAIKKLLHIIDTGTFGLIFLNPLSFTDHINTAEIMEIKGYSIYDDHMSFLKKVNINITFISGNVINRDFLSQSTMGQLTGSYLAQVDFILSALFLSPRNCYVHDQILAVQSDNSGSYNLIKVFSENFNDIIVKFENRQGIKNIKKIIDIRLLILFFPYYLLKLKMGQHNFSANYNFDSLYKQYRRYIFYWIFTYPIIKLPLPFAKIYYFFVRLCRKTFVTYDNLFNDHVLKQSDYL